MFIVCKALSAIAAEGLSCFKRNSKSEFQNFKISSHTAAKPFAIYHNPCC